MEREISLSPRQKEVLNSLSRGSRVQEIAFELDIKPETVNLHAARTRNKLNAKTNCHAIRLAFQLGLLELD